MKLWLDDIRVAPPGWVWVKNVEDAWYFWYAWRDYVTHMSLDHDLGDNVPTGYDFINKVEALMMQNQESINTWFTVHSANPVGRLNMNAAINSIEQRSSDFRVEPFTELQLAGFSCIREGMKKRNRKRRDG
jgi:hypothetical protein